MIVQVYSQGDFMRKKYLLPLGFEPITLSSCYKISFSNLSPRFENLIARLWPLDDLATVTKISVLVNNKIFQSM